MARLLTLGFVLALISLLFFAFGLSLIHTALFTLSNMSVEAKFNVALLLGGLEIIVAISILLFLFNQKMWGRFFGVHHVVNAVIKDMKQKNMNEGKDETKSGPHNEPT